MTASTWSAGSLNLVGAALSLEALRAEPIETNLDITAIPARKRAAEFGHLLRGRRATPAHQLPASISERLALLRASQHHATGRIVRCRSVSWVNLWVTVRRRTKVSENMGYFGLLADTPSPQPA
jgi:hypothetical protein